MPTQLSTLKKLDCQLLFFPSLKRNNIKISLFSSLQYVHSLTAKYGCCKLTSLKVTNISRREQLSTETLVSYHIPCSGDTMGSYQFKGTEYHAHFIVNFHMEKVPIAIQLSLLILQIQSLGPKKGCDCLKSQKL